MFINLKEKRVIMKKVNIQNAEYYKWGENCEGWHFLKRKDASVIKEKMPPATFEKMHYHEKSRQLFYILEGEASIQIGEELIDLFEGEAIEIEPRTPHQIRNNQNIPLEFILFSYPSTGGDRIDL